VGVGIPHLVNNISTKQIGDRSIASAGAGRGGWMEEWDDDDDGIIIFPGGDGGLPELRTCPRWEYVVFVFTDGAGTQTHAWLGVFFLFFCWFFLLVRYVLQDRTRPSDPAKRCVGQAPFLLLPSPPKNSR
jgi:hypothetical protein